MITNLYFNSYYAHIDLFTFITAIPGRCYFFPDYYFIFCRYIFYRFRKQALSVFELAYLENEPHSTAYCQRFVLSLCIYPAAGLESPSPFLNVAPLADGDWTSFPETCLTELGPCQLCHCRRWGHQALGSSRFSQPPGSPPQDSSGLAAWVWTWD